MNYYIQEINTLWLCSELQDLAFFFFVNVLIKACLRLGFYVLFKIS